MSIKLDWIQFIVIAVVQVQSQRCSSYRIHKVVAVLPGPHCAAKYPAERGSEGRRACWRHTPKLHLSTGQRHFNLHRAYTQTLFHLCFVSLT